MFDDLKQSITSTFTDRIQSPLYGTFIISWLIWNWKIFYLSFFISEKRIDGNKLDYIINNLWDIHTILWYPLISTGILIIIIPVFNNISYWLTVLFKKWRNSFSDRLLRNQRLSIKESITLKKLIQNTEANLNDILKARENEIHKLEEQVKYLQNDISEYKVRGFMIDSEWNKIHFDEFFKNEYHLEAMSKISQYIQMKLPIPSESIDHTNILLEEQLIKEEDDKLYTWTRKGEYYITHAIRTELFKA
jgi:hypothetical protein